MSNGTADYPQDLPSIAKRVYRHHLALYGDIETDRPGLIRVVKDTEADVADVKQDMGEVKREVEEWARFRRDIKTRFDTLIAVAAVAGLANLGTIFQFLKLLFGWGP